MARHDRRDILALRGQGPAQKDSGDSGDRKKAAKKAAQAEKRAAAATSRQAAPAAGQRAPKRQRRNVINISEAEASSGGDYEEEGEEDGSDS